MVKTKNLLLKHIHIISIVLCFVLFTFAAVSLFDTDFVWSVKQADTITSSHSFYTTDNGSYTMPSFQAIPPSWLASIVMSFLYHSSGYLLVAMVMSIMALAAVLLVAQGEIWIALLTATAYVYGFGVRAHVFSFLFTAVLLRFRDFFFSSRKKSFILLPLLMVLWTNLHAGFLLGIIYLWGYVVIDVFLLGKKYPLKRKMYLLSSVVLTTVSTLVNPYGIDAWKLALTTSTNTDLRQYIFEWRPIGLPDPGVFILIGAFVLSVYYVRKLSWNSLFAIMLLIQGLFSSRLIPLFAVSASIIIVEAFRVFVTKQTHKVNVKRLKVLRIVFTVLCLFIFTVEFALYVHNRLTLMLNYIPNDTAVSYLRSKPLSGNIFTFYRWDGYLRWAGVSQKTFLDGRMIVWIQEPRSHELASAFKTYTGILNGSINYQPVFDEFCIGTIVWSQKQLGSYWDDNITSRLFIKGLGTEWQQEYLDDQVMILKRKLPVSCNK